MERNYVMELIIILSSIIFGTFSIGAIIKIVFDELFKYKSKSIAPYQKNLSNLIDGCTETVSAMLNLILKETGNDNISTINDSKKKKEESENLNDFWID